jgi:hypothetical protein
MMTEAEQALALPRRLVVLGASNVAFGLPTVLATARDLWGGPLDILAAFGHGRSYGLRMAVLWRELPGLIECGLWQALKRRAPVPTTALLTDVGNDLLYEMPVPDIAAWVETCVDRLQLAGARVVMTPLPLCNIATLSPRRFYFFRTLFFPASRLQYDTLLGWARELDGRLRRLAENRGVALAEPRAEWYGLDPIHIRRTSRRSAWRALLSTGMAGPPPRVTRTFSLRHSVRLWMLAPEQRWIFGWPRRRAQPVGRLEDGTTVALY